MSRKISCILLLLSLSIAVVLVETKSHSAKKHHNHHEKNKNRVFGIDSSKTEDEIHKKEESMHVSELGRGVKHHFKRLNGSYPFKHRTGHRHTEHMARNHKSQHIAHVNHNQLQHGATSHYSRDGTENHRTTSKINSHHKQRHQAHTDKHHAVHVPDRHVTSRHHTREATNEDDVSLTDSLYTTNAINQNDLKDRTEGAEQPSIPHKRGSFPTSGETMHNHPGIVADSEGDDVDEDHMASGKSELLQPFQEVSDGCYNLLTQRQVEEGGSDVHYQSCTLCECLKNKLYCVKYCQM